ncbi:MAG: hypothetical protein U0807_17850 [Candidatus Binatia bacterium]
MEHVQNDWPEPTSEAPTEETLAAWTDENRCQTTDGCWVERGVLTCPHGHPSWLVALGRMPDETGD